jgi:hypothetical protein
MLNPMLRAGAVLIFLGCSRALAAPPIAELPWLHEGLQITSTWYAAIAPGTGSSFVEDEHGNWVVAETGKTFKRSDRQGTDASGLSQVTVACIDGQNIVLVSQGYATATALGIPAPVPLQNALSFVVSPDDAPDYWMLPSKLAAMRSDPSHGISVAAVQWKLADRVIDAIRVQNVGAAGYVDHVYDRKTGGCVHFATASRGNNVPKVLAPGETPQGDLTLTQGDFVAMRDLNVPWAKQQTPAAAAAAKALHYRGSLTMLNGLPTPPSQITLDLKITDRGDGWLSAAATSQTQFQGLPPTPASTSQISCGRAQFAGLWAGPAALAQMQRGQVLDEDPLTKMRTIVAKVSDTSVVISHTNSGGQIANEYDKRSGLLTTSSFINAIARQQILVRLQARE